MKLPVFFSMLFMLLSQAVTLSAQETAPKVQMAENFYGEGKIYIVIAVMTIIFVGLIIYMIRLERKIKQLEQKDLRN